VPGLESPNRQLAWCELISDGSDAVIERKYMCEQEHYYYDPHALNPYPDLPGARLESTTRQRVGLHGVSWWVWWCRRMSLGGCIWGGIFFYV